MKKLLIQLDCDPLASVFDTVAAYDAGADRVMHHGGVMPVDVRGLVHGAMFTRGGKSLKNSAVFIGGSDVVRGEEMLGAAESSFFGPVRVSLMMDANGCNTTAAAAVRKMISAGPVKDRKVVVLAGTGPVGMRAAGMLAGEGAEVILTSRNMEGAEKACEKVHDHFGVAVTPSEVRGEEDLKILDGAHGVLCAGAAGICLLPESAWMNHSSLKVLADVNAVPPLGIGETESQWDGETVNGKTIFGAIGIGGLKMKIHHECVSRLFTRNDLVLDAREIYAIAESMEA